MSAAQQAVLNAKMLAGMARKTRGLCMSVDDVTGTAVVNVGGGQQPMPIVGVRPTVGFDVWVMYVGQEPLCLGPVFRSPGGVVAVAPVAGKVSVTGDDGVTRSLPYASVLTLAVGDRVVVDWASQLVIAKPASEPALVPVLPPNPGGGNEIRESVFRPVGSGTFGTAWFTDQVWAGDTSTGAYFYDGIEATIPDTAPILSVDLYLHALSTFGGNPLIGLHSLAGKSGPPTVTDAVPVSAATGWKSLPTLFGDLLKTGPRVGVGTNTGGFNKYAPAGENNSGTLVIKWRG